MSNNPDIAERVFVGHLSDEEKVKILQSVEHDQRIEISRLRIVIQQMEERSNTLASQIVHLQGFIKQLEDNRNTVTYQEYRSIKTNIFLKLLERDGEVDLLIHTHALTEMLLADLTSDEIKNRFGVSDTAYQ